VKHEVKNKIHKHVDPEFLSITNLIFFFFFAVLGFGLRAYILSHSTSHFFVKVFFEVVSRELFAQASFEP
jgi:hypothetical protein